MKNDKYIDEKQRFMLPETAMAVYLPIKAVKIQLYWEDATGFNDKEFNDVHQLADFLKYNPVLARAVGYVAKKKE
jgi:hypothetical protein